MGRRTTSRLTTAMPLLGAARLATLLGSSVGGAGLMLEELVACGDAVEMTGRGSHRLYGLPGTDGIRGETAGPRRHGHRRGRPPKVVVPEPLAATEPPPPPVPARLERLEVDYTALDALLADTSWVVERVQAILKMR